MKKNSNSTGSKPHLVKEIYIPLLLIFGFWGIVVLFTRDLYPLPQIHAAQDLGVFLDSGYRLTQGQLPHRDYSSSFGPVYALFTGLPLVIGGAYYDSYTLYPAILGAFFSILAAITLRKLLEPTLLVAFALAVGLTAGGTFQVGNPPEWLSFSTHYNRLGYAFLMILSGVSFLPPLQEKRGETERALLSGFFTAGLFFLKINFFVVACLIVATGAVILIGRYPLRYLSLAAIGFIITAIFGFFILDWDISGYIRDMRMIAAARFENPRGVSDYTAGTILASNLPILAVTLVLLICLFQRRCWRGLLGSMCIVTLTLLLGMTQSSGAGFGLPSLAAAFVVSAAWLLANPTASIPIDKTARIAVLGITCAAIVWFIALPQASSYAAWTKISSDVTNQYGPPRRNVKDPISTLVVGDRNTWGNNFTSLVVEARGLAATHLGRSETLLFVDYTNPVSFAGGYKSPINAYLFIDKSVNLCRHCHLSPDKLFADADYLMVSKTPMGIEHTQLWIDIYGDFLDNYFEPIEESEHFKLLKKLQDKVSCRF